MKTSFLCLFMVLAFALLAGPASTTEFIKVDQFGYFCQSKKIAVVVDPQEGFNAAQSFNPGLGNNQYQVRRWDDNTVVFSGTLQQWNNGQTHSQSGDRGWWFDFSGVTQPGSYYVFDVQNQVGSFRFDIGDQVYEQALSQAIRMFFYQRINFAKKTPYVEAKYTDGASFDGPGQDKEARSRYDKSNASTARDLRGGWFDAGDPNKYTTFTFDPLLQMLDAYRQYPAVFKDQLNIPESGNGIPDLLDEIKWELDWLKRMQDGTGTNGFFLKLGVDNFSDVSPPSQDRRPRYYVGECTSATITGAAVFALAGQVYKNLPQADLKTYGEDLLQRAQKAWTRAQNTSLNFTQFQTTCDDQDIKSGDADRTGPEQLGNAIAAAVHLYEATGDEIYKRFVEANYTKVRPYSDNYWSPYNLPVAQALLKYTTLPKADQTVVNNILRQKTNSNWLFSIDPYRTQKDLYRAYMEDWAHHWGSNMVRSNSGNINLDFNTFRINPSNRELYRETAEQYLHWMHGLNPLNMVMLSNMYAFGAEKCVDELYHTWFNDKTEWDNARTSTKGPPPGYITGGPNKDFSVRTIAPPAAQPPQKAYKDWNAGWPENSWEISEPAIYYQGAYIALLSRLIGTNDQACSSTTPLREPIEKAAQILVYPQPAQDQLRVEYEGLPVKSIQVSMLDLTGRLVLSREVESGTFNLELQGLPNGLYVLQVKNQGWVSGVKVLLQR
jgi:endoglucanase